VVSTIFIDSNKKKVTLNTFLKMPLSTQQLFNPVHEMVLLNP